MQSPSENSVNNTGNSETGPAFLITWSWVEGSGLYVRVLTSHWLATATGKGCNRGQGGALHEEQYQEELTAERYQPVELPTMENQVLQCGRAMPMYITAPITWAELEILCALGWGEKNGSPQRAFSGQSSVFLNLWAWRKNLLLVMS